MVLKRSECLGALVFGHHFQDPWYSVANSFNYILDAVSQLPGFEIYALGNHELGFKTSKINVALDHRALITKSPLFMENNLLKYIKTEGAEMDGVRLPTRIFGSQREYIKTFIRKSERGAEKERKDFVNETVHLIRTLDNLIMGGLQPFKFIGLVEYYFVPLDKVKWDILESFTIQANIEGADNSEKFSVNRYDIQDDRSGVDKCLIFSLDRPKSSETGSNLAAGSFDFQIIPKEAIKIDEFGGAKYAMESLSDQISHIIDQSGFMKFSEIE
jgi:hypothetical protein